MSLFLKDNIQGLSVDSIYSNILDKYQPDENIRWYEQFFPSQFSPNLNYELFGSILSRPVVASVVAENTEGLSFSKDSFDKMFGSIPKLRLEHYYFEPEIRRLQELQASNDPRADKILADEITRDLQTLRNAPEHRWNQMAGSSLYNGTISAAVSSGSTNYKGMPLNINWMNTDTAFATESALLVATKTASVSCSSVSTDFISVVQSAITTFKTYTNNQNYPTVGILSRNVANDLKKNQAFLKYLTSLGWGVESTNFAMIQDDMLRTIFKDLFGIPELIIPEQVYSYSNANGTLNNNNKIFGDDRLVLLEKKQMGNLIWAPTIESGLVSDSNELVFSGTNGTTVIASKSIDPTMEKRRVIAWGLPVMTNWKNYLSWKIRG